MFDTYLASGFLLIALISGLPLLVSCVVGIVVSVLQAATQIQEQTISFFARVVTVSLVFIVLGDYFFLEAVSFMQELLSSIAYLGAMP